MAGWEEPEHRLDAERLRDLFVSLDSQIGLRCVRGQLSAALRSIFHKT